MSSKGISAAIAIFLSLNIFFASTVAACGTCPWPYPKPNPKSTPIPIGLACPRDALKLAVCANVLGLVNAVVGSPPVTPCCSLLDGLADLEAALCLCTAIKANILGISLNIPTSLTLLLNVCSKYVPKDFQCV